VLNRLVVLPKNNICGRGGVIREHNRLQGVNGGKGGEGREEKKKKKRGGGIQSPAMRAFYFFTFASRKRHITGSRRCQRSKKKKKKKERKRVGCGQCPPLGPASPWLCNQPTLAKSGFTSAKGGANDGELEGGKKKKKKGGSYNLDG